jgi:hypothetical protein
VLLGQLWLADRIHYQENIQLGVEILNGPLEHCQYFDEIMQFSKGPFRISTPN